MVQKAMLSSLMTALPAKSRVQSIIANCHPSLSTISAGIAKRIAMKIGIAQQLHGQKPCASTEENTPSIVEGCALVLLSVGV